MSVGPCLKHGIDNVVRVNVRQCLGHDIDIDMSMSGTWHWPHYESQCYYPKLMRYESSYDVLSATKLISRIKGRRRHRSHYHLKLLV
ncbi:Pre-mRNA 3'-end-processing factor FIP1 [Gossypium arboreum]|uniref:Pre-mRNA 3'-end-processing factor FIP1 n=1 Tax=Gossypium arboreum TaxID=29729 RepID=A0A0B0NLJ3_GOSAR|nr:Pre-mRNA 3'-end-processing factor FIP1 [Gossypium arboreum]